MILSTAHAFSVSIFRNLHIRAAVLTVVTALSLISTAAHADYLETACGTDPDGDGVANSWRITSYGSGCYTAPLPPEPISTSCWHSGTCSSLSSDNCPSMSNANQLNTDGDTQGDACDSDDDNDGVADGSDNCPIYSNADQLDTDRDGLGNVCDSTPGGRDQDSDGVDDLLDAFPGDDCATTDTDTDGKPDQVYCLYPLSKTQGSWSIGANGSSLRATIPYAASGSFSLTVQLNKPRLLSYSNGYRVSGPVYASGTMLAVGTYTLSWYASIPCAGFACFESTSVSSIKLGWTSLILDEDDDNDSVPDVSDAFPLNASESRDTDHDGIGNNADLDDDNDGVPDYIDAEPLNPANANEKLLPVNSNYQGGAIVERVSP